VRRTRLIFERDPVSIHTAVKMAGYDVYARGNTMEYYDDDTFSRQSERSRWTPLTRMLLSGEMTQERQKNLSGKEKFNRWMINEGYRRV
jgi:hypothetical protein